MVSTNKALLHDDKESRLYKTAVLRISAEYNALTRGLRSAHLIEFVEHTSGWDEGQPRA